MVKNRSVDFHLTNNQLSGGKYGVTLESSDQGQDGSDPAGL